MKLQLQFSEVGALFIMYLCGSAGKESTCNAGDLGSIPRLGRSPGGGHGNPHRYSCLENPVDREANKDLL